MPPCLSQIYLSILFTKHVADLVFLPFSANEHTVNAGKKTISPADVFKALEDTEFSFLKPRLEAEFDSTFFLSNVPPFLLWISKRIVPHQPRLLSYLKRSSTTHNYVEFNAIQTEKRTSYRNKVKATKGDPDKSGVAAGDNSTLADDSINGKATAAGDDTDMADVTADLDKGDSSAPRTKKPRVDGAETEEEEEEEDAEDVDDEVEEDEPEQDEDEEEDEEDDDENDGGSGDETQDALEDKDNREDRDEALDGDDSD